MEVQKVIEEWAGKMIDLRINHAKKQLVGGTQ